MFKLRNSTCWLYLKNKSSHIIYASQVQASYLGQCMRGKSSTSTWLASRVFEYIVTWTQLCQSVRSKDPLHTLFNIIERVDIFTHFKYIHSVITISGSFNSDFAFSKPEVILGWVLVFEDSIVRSKQASITLNPEMKRNGHSVEQNWYSRLPTL